MAQKGQLVDAERARFDFSHSAPVTEDELAAIEAEVNAVIRQNVPAETQADGPRRRHRGRRHRPVRREVRRRGAGADAGPVAHVSDNAPYSVELCGGTHVARTGDIGLFKVVQETGVAAGVRRIEALTGEAARLYLEGQAKVARGLARDFKIQPAGRAGPRRGPARPRSRTLEKQVAELKKQLALGGGSGASMRRRRRSAGSS